MGETLIALLTLLSALAALAFLATVAVFVTRIMRVLERIGGKDSLLAKIRYGVRAIEVETGHIAPQVTQLNGALSAAAGGFAAIDATLGRIVTAAVAQERAS